MVLQAVHISQHLLCFWRKNRRMTILAAAPERTPFPHACKAVDMPVILLPRLQPGHWPSSPGRTQLGWLLVTGRPWQSLRPPVGKERAVPPVTVFAVPWGRWLSSHFPDGHTEA